MNFIFQSTRIINKEGRNNLSGFFRPKEAWFPYQEKNGNVHFFILKLKNESNSRESDQTKGMTL